MNSSNDAKTKSCVALGDFDGVHLGHRKLIRLTVDNEFGYVPTVYTFKNNCKGSKLVTGFETKSQLMKALGIKSIVADDFEAVKHLSAREFVDVVLVSRLSAGAVVCGSDFRFGFGAQGDAVLLKSLCERQNIHVTIVPPVIYNGEKLSSTMIRKAIECGDMLTAHDMLGRYFTMSGTVVHGKQLARKYEMATANFYPGGSLVLPQFGVYATHTVIRGIRYNSISNVGVRPSVDVSAIPNVETRIFDYDGTIYGDVITVEFVKMIRKERKFESERMLFTQISRDISDVKKYLSENSYDQV